MNCLNIAFPKSAVRLSDIERITELSECCISKISYTIASLMSRDKSDCFNVV